MSNTNTLPILRSWPICWFFILLPFACTQSQQTANDTVPTFPNTFDFGANMGNYPPHFTDKALAALAHGTVELPESGVGVSSIRPGLFDYFLDHWGNDIRLEHFRFYDSIGLRNTVVISGFPAERNRDSTFYCAAARSQMFRDMYSDIWDNGENGTPVNDENPYALYIWKAANTYKGLIKIWEVWNEPDLDTGNGYLLPGQPGNWWENAPQPCETAIKAPVFFYIRALRITYEVVKSVDPTAFVAVGGLGWPSYLDAICRYSDNPLDGAVDSKQYPNKGGAYFDCMSFHTYPHLNNSLRKWRNELNDFQYFRHSDAATEGVWSHKNALRDVLEKYGYDDTRYPRKIWICSEFNIPRKPFGDFIGSEAAQVNFLVKTLVTAQKEGMSQMHLYSLSDEKSEDKADSEFCYMGLFKNLENKTIATPNAIAYALKTTSLLLKDATYDPVRTMAMLAKDPARGFAFKHKNGAYTYVLWAKTTLDRDETSNATYSFPKSFGLEKVNLKAWDFSLTNKSSDVDAQQILLTGTPVFLR